MSTFAPPRPAVSTDPRGRGNGAVSRPTWIFTVTMLFLSATAVLVGSIALSRSADRGANHTLAEGPSKTATSADAALRNFCAAWSTSSAAITAASNASAAAPADWNDPRTQVAIQSQMRTTLVESSFLKGRMTPELPPDIRQLAHSYLTASFDELAALNRRMGTESDKAVDRSNAAALGIQRACTN